MRRTLNVRFLLVLLAGLAVASGGVALAHHLQYRRIPLALLKQARLAEDEGDLKRADDYLTRYLEFEPDDVEQKARLARILTGNRMLSPPRGLNQRAYFLLQDVLTSRPDDHELRRLFVPLAIKIRQLAEAEEELKHLPHDAATEALWGQLFEAKGDAEQAVVRYREAVKLEPDPVTVGRLVKLLYARAYTNLTPAEVERRRQADVSEASAVVDAMVRAAPDSWEARIARWNYYRDYWLFERRGQKRNSFFDMVRTCLLQETSKDVDKALELREGEATVRLAAAEAASLAGELESARAHLDKAIQLHRRDPQVFRALTALELKAEDRQTTREGRRQARERALQWLRQGTQELKPPAQSELLWSLAVLLLDTGSPRDLEEAESVIRQYRAHNASPAGADYLQGRLLMGRQQWAEAAALLERAYPLLSGIPDLANQIDQKLGTCYDELGDATRQHVAFKRLKDRDPRSLAARMGMAQAARAMGRLDEALRLYTEAVSLPDVPQVVWVDYIRLAVLKARHTRDDRDWKRVADALADGRQRKLADEVGIVILEAEYLLGRELSDKAREILEKASKDNPKRAELWAARAALAERLKDPDEALNLLNEADQVITEPAERPELILARANYWVQRRNDRSVAEIKKLTEGLEGFRPVDRARLLHGLAEALYRVGSPEEAGKLWHSLAALDDYRADLRLRLVLFDLALQQGSEDDMEKVLTDIRRLEGRDGTFARHAEALRLVWRVKSDRVARDARAEALRDALKLIDQVSAARPDWPPALLARAEVETLRGNPDQAIEDYRKAYQREHNPVVLRQLVELLRKQGKIEEANAEMKRAGRDLLARANLERSAAEVALLNHDTFRAIELAQEMVREDSRDFRDHLWIGQLLAGTGQKPDVAEQHLRRALQLETKESDPWVALVRFLVARDRKKEAEDLVALAAGSIKPDQAKLAAARIHTLLGDAEKGGPPSKDSPHYREARAQYEKAIEERPADCALLTEFAAFLMQRDELSESETVVRRILESDVKKTPEEEEWAHGRLAILLSAGENFSRFREALRHVGLRMEDGGDLVVDETYVRGESLTMKRVAARVLVTHLHWRTREEAVKRLEELDRRQALVTEDRFLLAQLYEARGDWEKAHQQFIKVSQAPDRKPQHLIAHAQGLLANGRKDEAGRMIAALAETNIEKVMPGGDLAMLELQARLHEARGEGDRALTLLRERLDAGGDRGGQEILLLMASFGRQKRFDEALGFLDRLWKLAPPDVAGGTSVALLRAARATEEHRKQVETYLREALKKDAANVTLLVMLGDVLDLQGEHEDAEGVYREALKAEPTNVMALNNLAWLLAQRARQGEEALRLITTAIETAGPRGELLDTRSVVFLTLGRPAQARADLDLAIKEAPTPTRLFHLARAHHLANDRQGARRAFQQAKDLGLKPNDLHPVEQVAHRKLEEALSQ